VASSSSYYKMLLGDRVFIGEVVVERWGRGGGGEVVVESWWWRGGGGEVGEVVERWRWRVERCMPHPLLSTSLHPTSPPCEN
jgi:hypothetical protein